jgi:hypothetical protein
MASAVTERRLQARFASPSVARMRATLRPGNAASLVNVSSSGALVHAARPLRPGARVHLQLGAGAQSVPITARVLRCSIAAINASDGVVYSGALKFDTPCDLPWERRSRRG